MVTTHNYLKQQSRRAQLLMLNSQIETIHSGDSRTKDAIQGNISKKD